MLQSCAVEDVIPVQEAIDQPHDGVMIISLN